ncbi:MAG: hypothetical protein IPG42_03395 [Betaproteobacteria bacterium]|nr:hypothetical protein [Betaproteobacteria bacterium]
MPIAKPRLPQIIYEPLPYMYIGIGCCVSYLIDHPGVLTCGALLIFLGISISALRIRYRKQKKNLIKNARIRAMDRNRQREEVDQALAKRKKSAYFPKTEVTPLN